MMNNQTSDNSPNPHSPQDENNHSSKPKYRGILEGIAGLSLGISMVVAILLGVGFGVLLEKIFGVSWVFWIGVVFGVAAAILNIYKAYKTQLREFEILASEPKYQHKKDNLCK